MEPGNLFLCVDNTQECLCRMIIHMEMLRTVLRANVPQNCRDLHMAFDLLGPTLAKHHITSTFLCSELSGSPSVKIKVSSLNTRAN